MELLVAVGFVKSGKNRRDIFIALDKPMMPSELVVKIYGKSSNTYFTLVSRALGELRKRKLVEVVNPGERTGRIYRRTALGKRVVEELE